MDANETGLEIVGVRGTYRAHGTSTAGQMAYTISGVLGEARNRGLREVVLDIRNVRGFESPGPAFRRWAAQMWAGSAGSFMRVAMVARAEHICPEKTGLLVAAEHGLRAGIFESERRGCGLAGPRGHVGGGDFAQR